VAATDPSAPPHDLAQDLMVRERATTASSFDPTEISQGHQSASAPSIALAILPLAIGIAVTLFKLPGLDTSYLAEEAWGATPLSAVGGVWPLTSLLGHGTKSLRDSPLRAGGFAASTLSS